MHYRYSTPYNMQDCYNITPPMAKRGLELARAYIPYQRYTKSFSPMEALEHGTMFPELVRPYKGRGERGNCCYEC